MAKEERSQEVVAQVGLLGHDGSHLFDGNPEDAPGLGGDCRQEHALTGEQAFLAKELARPVRDEHLLLGLAVLIDDVDGAFENHDQVVALVALGEEEVAAFHLSSRRHTGGGSRSAIPQGGVERPARRAA